MINTKNAQSEYSNVTASTDPTLLVAENGNRVGLYIYNNSSATLKVLIGALPEDATMSGTTFSFIIGANSLYEMPYEYTTLKFTGIWASATGSANITEIKDF